MAELGTAGKDAVPGGTSGTEVISAKEADAVYEAELAKDDGPAPEDKGGEGNGSESGNEGGSATPLDDEAARAKVEADKAEAEEKDLLANLGFDPGVTVPKELIPHLRKVHEKTQGEIGRLSNEVNRRGSQNKQVSDQYQAVKKELDTFKAQVNSTPEARVAALKERLGKIDISKLPAGTQKLLGDDEYLMTLAALDVFPGAAAPVGKPEGKADSDAGIDDLPPELKEPVAKAHPEYLKIYQSNEFAAWVNAQPMEQLDEKLKTAEGHIEVLSAFKEDFKKATEAADEQLAGEIAKSHSDFKEVFGKPEFRGWIVKQSRSEQMKLRDTDPKGFIEVLNNFKSYQLAEKSLSERESARKKKLGDSAGLEAVGGGGGKYDDLSPEDILNMPDADFNKFDKKVATGGR